MRQLLLTLFQDWIFATLASARGWPAASCGTTQPAHVSLSRASATRFSTSRSAFPCCVRCPSPASKLPGAHVHRSTSHVSVADPPNRGSPHGHRRSPSFPLPLPWCIARCTQFSHSCGAALVSRQLSRRHPPLHFLCPLTLSPVHALCSTGHCDRPSAPQPDLVARPSLPGHSRRSCRASFLLGFFSTHCTSPRYHHRRPQPFQQPSCRRPDCSEPAPRGCSVGFCNLHCTSPVVCSTIPCPCRETVRGRLAGERRRRDPIFSRSVCCFGVVQLPSVVGSPRCCPRWVHGSCQLPEPVGSPHLLCPGNPVTSDGPFLHRSFLSLRWSRHSRA